ncbi:hypothetical protein YC2023_010885 [Brassica napus]
MASRWWDPGDLGVCGEFSSREGFGLAGWKVVLILRWFGLKRDKGIRERLRNHRIIRDLLAILIFIKTVSQSREGNISGDCQSTDFGFLMEIGGINYRLYWIFYGVLDDWFWDWSDMLHYSALKFPSEIFLCIWMCGNLNGCLGIEWYSSRLMVWFTRLYCCFLCIWIVVAGEMELVFGYDLSSCGFEFGVGLMRSLIQKVCIGENGNGVIANILVQDGGFVGSDGVVYYGGGIIVTLAQDHLVLASGLEKMEMIFQCKSTVLTLFDSCFSSSYYLFLFSYQIHQFNTLENNFTNFEFDISHNKSNTLYKSYMKVGLGVDRRRGLSAVSVCGMSIPNSTCLPRFRGLPSSTDGQRLSTPNLSSLHINPTTILNASPNEVLMLARDKNKPMSLLILSRFALDKLLQRGLTQANQCWLQKMVTVN